jgi:hypothetical protein
MDELQGRKAEAVFSCPSGVLRPGISAKARADAGHGPGVRCPGCHMNTWSRRKTLA